MLKFIYTKEKKWLEKWDAYVCKHPKGSHLIYSDWLKSYKSYGFDFEIGLVLDDGTIVGGYGVVIPKFLFFKFYIIPHGPIYNEAYERHLNDHLLQIKQRAKHIGACYMQFSLPISSNENISTHVYPITIVESLPEVFKSGKRFSYVYSSYGLNWVSIEDFNTAELFLEQLSPKVRRNVRMPYNKNAKAAFVKDPSAIKKGYDVITENARQANYSVRDFKEFETTILSLIKKDLAYFVNCEMDKDVKAAGFFVCSGGYITNITGGVLREKPDIKLGYMLQWEIIKKSFELECKGYNISMGGSLGVQDFKSKFGAETIHYESPYYNAILNPFYFKLFTFFDVYLKPHKARVSKVLSHFKK